MAFVTPVVEHWLEEELVQWVNNEQIIYHGGTSKKKLFNDVLHTLFTLLLLLMSDMTLDLG